MPLTPTLSKQKVAKQILREALKQGIHNTQLSEESKSNKRALLCNVPLHKMHTSNSWHLLKSPENSETAVKKILLVCRGTLPLNMGASFGDFSSSTLEVLEAFSVSSATPQSLKQN